MAPYEPVSAAAIWAQLAPPPLPSIQSEEVAGHSLTSVFHLAHELGGGGGVLCAAAEDRETDRSALISTFHSAETC